MLVRSINRITGGTDVPQDITPHQRIHDGVMFSVDTVTPTGPFTVAASSNLDLVITATGNNHPHPIITYKLNGPGKVLVYELAEDSVTGGTSAAVTNKKYDSENVFLGTAVINPTINMAGAAFKEGDVILGGPGIGMRMAGSAATFGDEIIMRPNRPLLIRLINDSAEIIAGSISVSIYNAKQIRTNGSG
jgi:hypothetical protein